MGLKIGFSIALREEYPQHADSRKPQTVAVHGGAQQPTVQRARTELLLGKSNR